MYLTLSNCIYDSLQKDSKITNQYSGMVVDGLVLIVKKRILLWCFCAYLVLFWNLLLHLTQCEMPLYWALHTKNFVGFVWIFHLCLLERSTFCTVWLMNVHGQCCFRCLSLFTLNNIQNQFMLLLKYYEHVNISALQGNN